MQLVVDNQNTQESAELTIDLFFQHWQIIHDYKRARLDDKRRKLIQDRLKDGYSLQDLADAVSGAFLSPFHMGENDRSKRFNDLGLILRDAAHVDEFVNIFDSAQARFAKIQTKRNQPTDLPADYTSAENARQRLEQIKKLMGSRS